VVFLRRVARDNPMRVIVFVGPGPFSTIVDVVGKNIAVALKLELPQCWRLTGEGDVLGLRRLIA
jgi:hypothetical protein